MAEAEVARDGGRGGAGGRGGYSAAPEPLGEERVGQIGSALATTLDVALVREQAIERVLQSRACDPVLCGEPASGRCPPVRQRHQNHALDAPKAVPGDLMGISGLRLGRR